MVQVKCECRQLHETEINSWDLFQDITDYFEKKENDGLYEDIPVTKPYYIGYSHISGEH